MSTYEQERDEKAYNYRLKPYDVAPGTMLEQAFKAGSDWANARAEKRAQVLVEALETISDRRWDIEVIHDLCRNALATYREGDE